MDYIQHALCMCVAVAFLGVSGSVVCPGLNSCISEFYNITTQTRFLFPPFTMKEYEDNCRRYKMAEQCIEEQQHCRNAANRTTKNTKALLDFMCFNKEDEYIDVGAECLSKIIMKSELLLCTQSYAGVPESMRDPSTYTKLDVDNFCSLTRDVLYCRYLVLEDHCGTAAARWQHQANVASYTVVLRAFKCATTLDKDFWVERTSLLVFFAVVTGLLLVCSIPLRFMFCPPTALINRWKAKNSSDPSKRDEIALDIVKAGSDNIVS